MRDLDSDQVPNRSVALVPMPSRPIAKLAARRAMERQTHDIVLQATQGGYCNQPFADWFSDLRRKQLRIYGGLLRFIDLSVMRGVAKDVLLKIPAWIAEYIREAFDHSPPPASSEKRKAA